MGISIPGLFELLLDAAQLFILHFQLYLVHPKLVDHLRHVLGRHSVNFFRARRLCLHLLLGTVPEFRAV
ncbi:MAG: hypothetical protein ABF291_00155 [Desulfobacterales bacterium]